MALNGTEQDSGQESQTINVNDAALGPVEVRDLPPKGEPDTREPKKEPEEVRSKSESEDINPSSEYNTSRTRYTPCLNTIDASEQCYI